MISNATGEESLGAILFSPIFFIISLSIGCLIATAYKHNDKPFFPKKRKNRLAVNFSLILVVMAIIIHIEPPHKGKVADYDSDMPIPNVLVHQTLTYTCVSPINISRPESEFMGYSETLTDAEGNYSIPLRIFFKPPLLCISDSNNRLAFLKAGYFTNYSPYRVATVSLKKANYFFDFKKTTDKSYFNSGYSKYDIDYNSKFIGFVKQEADKLYTIPNGEAGVFLSSPGREFTNLYKFYDDEEFESTLFYAFDKKSQRWFAFDKFGLPIEDKHTDTILGSVTNKLKYGDVSYIFFGPYSGSLHDNINLIFTIEQGGNYLCEYRKGEFVECISSENFPHERNDDSLSSTKFIAVMNNQREGYDIFTKTDKYLHHYNLIYRRNNQYVTKEIHEIMSSLTSKDVKAITGYKNKHLFGLSDGQIVWSTYNTGNNTLNNEFCSFIDDTGIETIESLLISHESRYPDPLKDFVYVTDGTDKIYRFTTSGHYDFKILSTDRQLNNIPIKDGYSTQLFRAIRNNENDLINKLLKAGADPNIVGKNNNTPLFFAVKRNNTIATKFLLHYGADTNFLDKDGLTPLRYSHDPEIIEFLLKYGADPNIKDSNDEPMLNFSRVYNHSDIIHSLLEKNLNINAVYKDGSTELHKCINNYNSSCEKTLLILGADPNFKDGNGRTPLLKAIENKEHCAKILLQFGANPNLKDSSGSYPIWRAVEKFNYKLIILLLNNGANAKIKNDYGQTLFWALFAKQNAPNDKIYDEILSKILLGNGVQLSTKDNNGQTILNWAEKTGQHEKAVRIMKLIANEEKIRNQYLTKSQRVNKAAATSNAPKKLSDRDKISLFVEQGDEKSMRTLVETLSQRDKNYALWMAATHMKPSITELLLKNGSDPNNVNAQGQSCLWKAVYYADVEIISLLIQYGVNINLRDKNGQTALWELTKRTSKDRLLNIKSLSGVVVEDDNGGVGKGGTYNIGDLIDRSLAKDIEAVQLLIDNGLNPSVPDYTGLTAYEIAIKNKNIPIVDVLSKHFKSKSQGN